MAKNAAASVLREVADDARAGQYFAGQPHIFATLAPIGYYALGMDPPAPGEESHTLSAA